MELIKRGMVSPIGRLSRRERQLLNINGIVCPEYVEDLPGLPLSEAHTKLIQEKLALPALDQVISHMGGSSGIAGHIEDDIRHLGHMQRLLASHGVKHILEGPKTDR